MAAMLIPDTLWGLIEPVLPKPLPKSQWWPTTPDKRACLTGNWCEQVIPGCNDSDQVLTRLAEYVAGASPEIPWHVAAFHKDYRMTDPENTRPETLIRAVEIGKKAGYVTSMRRIFPALRPEFVNVHGLRDYVHKSNACRGGSQSMTTASKRWRGATSAKDSDCTVRHGFEFLGYNKRGYRKRFSSSDILGTPIARS